MPKPPHPISPIGLVDGAVPLARHDPAIGPGLLTVKLALFMRDVIAIDTSPAMVDMLQQKEIDNVTSTCVDIDDPAVRSAPWFGEFDLIVASSVCSFLPNYETTLGLLARALRTTGYFVQWDWLASVVQEFGLTLDRVTQAFENADLSRVHIGKAFAAASEDREKPVLIAVAQI